MTEVRSGKLADLRFGDFTFTTCSDAKCIWVSGHICRCDGSAKTRHGGLKIVSHKPPEIIICNMIQVSESVKVFDDLQTFIDVVSTFRKSLDKFFCVVKYGESAKQKFFKNQKLY